MKVSTKSTLLSLLTISTLFCASLASAGPRPGSPGSFVDTTGLTPGQVANDNSSNDPRERERQAREEVRRQQERAERDRLERERERERNEWLAEQARQEFRREQHRLAEIARQQQEAIAAQQAEILRQQRALIEEANRLAAEREAAARKGSDSKAFSNVTRKKNGETLVVTLAQPMLLENIELAVLDKKAQFHQVVIRTDNGRAYLLNDSIDTKNPLTSNDMPQVADLRGVTERIQAIEVTVEGMGAQATINIEVNSLEGKPALKAIRPGKVIK